MASLFSDIQSWFDNGDYSGRYLAKLLRELARHEPRTFGRIFKLAKECWPTEKNGVEVVLEENYEKANKFVDLVLKKNGNPILLVEIKDKDYTSSKNPIQFKRYVDFVDKCKAPQLPVLVYVSRYSLGDWFDGEKAGLVLLKHVLKELKKSDGVLSRMFADYLEEIGVATYQHINLKDEKIEGKALTLMISNMLGFPHKHGLGALHSAERINAIPHLTGKLFANLEVLGDWVIWANPKLFSRVFNRGFVSCPQYDEKTAKTISNCEFVYRCASWGRVTFYTYASLPVDPRANGTAVWANVELGYHLDLEIGKKNKRPDIVLYASFNWQGKQNEKTKKSVFHLKEDAALRVFRSLLADALAEAKNAQPEDTIKRALDSFKIPALKSKTLS